MNKLKKDNRPITSCSGVAYPMPEKNTSSTSKQHVKTSLEQAQYKELEKKYWEMVYKHVDPMRKKGDEPIKEYIVYCSEICHKEWWDFITETVIPIAEKKGIEDNEIDFTKRLEVAVKEEQKKVREEMDLINGDKIENTWGQGIKTGREQVKKELKHKIGFLRQYLNERTSKKLITNGELEEWLK